MTRQDLEYYDITVTPDGRIKCMAQDLVVVEFDLGIDTGWHAASAFCGLAQTEHVDNERLRAAIRVCVPLGIALVLLAGYVCFLVGERFA